MFDVLWKRLSFGNITHDFFLHYLSFIQDAEGKRFPRFDVVRLIVRDPKFQVTSKEATL